MKNVISVLCVATLALPVVAAAADEGALEEIVVTAQRREESIQKAAIAIDAQSGDQLLQEGISTPEDLGKLVPALSFAAGGGNNSSIFMRGVGTRTNNAYLDTAITISYDGVFMGRSAAAMATSFYDIERVEVLKGPQGILYGRNATGGAINVLPVKPKLDRAGGYAMLAVGSYEERQLQGALNLPIGGNSALRFAFSRNKHEGYNKDGTNDADVSGARLQFLTEPSDNVSIRIGADYTKIGGIGNGWSYAGRYTPGNYAWVPSGLPVNEGTATPLGNAYRRTILGAPGFGFFNDLQDTYYQDYWYTGVNAEAILRTGYGTWTFIPAWRKSDGSSRFGGPAFNTGWIQDEHQQTSAELRLTSTGERRLDYIAGVYYFDETSDSNNTYNQEFVLPLQLYTHDVRSLAGFGQLTFHATDRLRLVGGARYTSDKKNMNGVIDNFIVFCGGPPPNNLAPPASFARGCAVPGNLPHFPTLDTPEQAFAYMVNNGWINPNTVLTGNTQGFPLLNGVGFVLRAHVPVVDGGTNSKFTWKTSVQYDVAPDSLLYATYETGYRAGGFQLAEGYPTYKPEFLNAASIGSKNRFLDGRLQFNAEIFWWKYKDQQINFFALSPNGVLVSTTQNVGESTNKGLDLDMVFAVTRNTRLSARYNYLRATYDDLHFITAPPRDNFGCPFTFTGQLAGGAPVKDFNCSGKPAMYSPQQTVNAGIDQTFPLSRVDLVASVNPTWRDDQWSSVEYLVHELLPSYWATDASLSVRAPDDKWSVTADARNLEDKRRPLSAQVPVVGAGMVSYGPGATYGLRVQAGF
ncbi:MAG: TonB-dependent receptor [Gammaproteobacteria bacterium]|nr:TonB-dependent receptor [Gammaproteobacteria bacterium]